VTFALLLFGFSSMIYNYYLAENSLNFFQNRNRLVFTVFKIISIILITWGSMQDLSSIFSFADLSMGLLAITNMIVIALLYKPALALIRGYETQRKQGVKPVLQYDNYNEYKVKPDPWKEIVDDIKAKA
jgi:AGCS family alanine or glycine:cation symporter